jgi:hypothetical protein
VLPSEQLVEGVNTADDAVSEDDNVAGAGDNSTGAGSEILIDSPGCFFLQWES